MEFGEVNKVQGATFDISQMDGIVGLAYDSISVDNLATYVESDNSTDKSFGFFLKNNPEQSYMTFPGFETEGVTLVGTHDVIEKTYWNLNFTAMTGPNGTQQLTGQKAAIDSGTSLIVGSYDIITPLVEGITVEEDCSNVSSLPDITFTFDSTDYPLTAEDYVVKVEEFGSTSCLMGIMGMDTPAGFDYVIVGDVFIRKYPSYFNLTDNTVSFYAYN